MGFIFGNYPPLPFNGKTDNQTWTGNPNVAISASEFNRIIDVLNESRAAFISGSHLGLATQATDPNPGRSGSAGWIWLDSNTKLNFTPSGSAAVFILVSGSQAVIGDLTASNSALVYRNLNVLGAITGSSSNILFHTASYEMVSQNLNVLGALTSSNSLISFHTASYELVNQNLNVLGNIVSPSGTINSLTGTNLLITQNTNILGFLTASGLLVPNVTGTFALIANLTASQVLVQTSLNVTGPITGTNGLFNIINTTLLTGSDIFSTNVTGTWGLFNQNLNVLGSISGTFLNSSYVTSSYILINKNLNVLGAVTASSAGVTNLTATLFLANNDTVLKSHLAVFGTGSFTRLTASLGFHVGSPATTSTDIIAGAVTLTGGSVSITQNSPVDTLALSNAAGGSANINLNGASNLAFGAGGNSTTHLVLNGDGHRIGIGFASAPGAMLHISGTSGVTSSLMVEGTMAHTRADSKLAFYGNATISRPATYTMNLTGSGTRTLPSGSIFTPTVNGTGWASAAEMNTWMSDYDKFRTCVKQFMLDMGASTTGTAGFGLLQ